MAKREASPVAYKNIVDNNYLVGRSLDVYKELYKSGPLTGRELDERIGHNAHSRLADLKRCGIVKEVDKRRCSISGMIVHAWDVTSATLTERWKKVKDVLLLRARSWYVAELQNGQLRGGEDSLEAMRAWVNQRHDVVRILEVRQVREFAHVVEQHDLALIAPETPEVINVDRDDVMSRKPEENRIDILTRPISMSA